MSNQFPKPAGFTLIELIVYLAIVSIILVSISYLIIDILQNQTRDLARQEVNYNLKFIANYLTRDIREANQIGSLSTTTLVLNFPAAKTVTYRFDRDSQSLSRQLNAGAFLPVSTDQVWVNGDFTDLSFKNKTKNVGILLIIAYKNPGDIAYFSASTSDSLAVELRGKR